MNFHENIKIIQLFNFEVFIAARDFPEASARDFHIICSNFA